MYGNKIIPLITLRVPFPTHLYPDFSKSLKLSSFITGGSIPKDKDPLVVGWTNTNNGKIPRDLVLSGIHYSPSKTPTLELIPYTPTTIKVQINKKGVPQKNAEVCLIDSNMICVDRAQTDPNGIAYFFNKPSTYKYHIICEDRSYEYVSTIASSVFGEKDE